MSKVSTELATVRQRINEWRRQYGGPGKRLPEDLWNAASASARENGVYATARELGLNYATLKKRTSAVGAEHPFVEVTMNGLDFAGTVVELIGRDGEQVRFHLREQATGDVIRVAEAFWSRLV